MLFALALLLFGLALWTAEMLSGFSGHIILFTALLCMTFIIVRRVSAVSRGNPVPRHRPTGANTEGDDTYVYMDTGFSAASDASPHDHGCADPGGSYDGGDSGACVDAGGHSGD